MLVAPRLSLPCVVSMATGRWGYWSSRLSVGGLTVGERAPGPRSLVGAAVCRASDRLSINVSVRYLSTGGDGGRRRARTKMQNRSGVWLISACCRCGDVVILISRSRRWRRVRSIASEACGWRCRWWHWVMMVVLMSWLEADRILFFFFIFRRQKKHFFIFWRFIFRLKKNPHFRFLFFFRY